MNTIKFGITFTDRNMVEHSRTFDTEQAARNFAAVLDKRIIKRDCFGYKIERVGATVEPGDKISALGHTYTVGRILYQDFYYRDGYNVEFIDTAGGYHHWKQWDDGGELIKPGKKYTNSYGTDCTDIFKKYGY